MVYMLRDVCKSFFMWGLLYGFGWRKGVLFLFKSLLCVPEQSSRRFGGFQDIIERGQERPIGRGTPPLTKS